MEQELDPDVIKTTQNSLGKYVKRPPLSEKLLKKPPFRFLHDIVTTVIKTTGFFEGLFEDHELISENVKDRDSKILFLSKVISVLGSTTGKTLSVKPSKIVAGQEPEKTNELLQCIAFALDNKLSSNEAVKKYKDGGKSQSDNKKEKVKNQSKGVKKSSDVKKLTSRSSENVISKSDASEKSTTRNEKTKQKETALLKKESSPKKPSTQQSKNLTKKNSVEKIARNSATSQAKRHSIVESNDINNTDKQKDDRNIVDQDAVATLEKEDLIDANALSQHITSKQPEEDPKESILNSSYTIAENDLNSSLSSQDLMEVNNENSEENQRYFSQEPEKEEETKPTHASEYNPPIIHNHKRDQTLHEDHKKQRTPINSRPSSSLIQDGRSFQGTPKSSINDAKSNTSYVKSSSINDAANNIRPKSVRPSSSRPGAPRLREKHDNIVTGNENLLVGKVNIIVENTPNEEEEDSSIIIVDQQAEAPSIPKNQPDMQLSLHQQHGALVQQILDSQKEFSQNAGKTEIEWQFGAQKAREAVNQEIEQLRYNIQALSRVANPLGKVLDHVQEDVEVMRQELQQWTKTYEEASKELSKQKTANEDSLFPIHTKLKQLDADILEKHDKINDLKIIIHKNSSRIERLLAGGDVQ